jgi:hypothetical protein
MPGSADQFRLPFTPAACILGVGSDDLSHVGARGINIADRVVAADNDCRLPADLPRGCRANGHTRVQGSSNGELFRCDRRI